jgi:hypothetical protein
LVIFLINLILAPTSSNAAAQNAILPGEMRTDATYAHISVLWWVEGYVKTIYTTHY